MEELRFHVAENESQVKECLAGSDDVGARAVIETLKQTLEEYVSCQLEAEKLHAEADGIRASLRLAGDEETDESSGPPSTSDGDASDTNTKTPTTSDGEELTSSDGSTSSEGEEGDPEGYVSALPT